MEDDIIDVGLDQALEAEWFLVGAHLQPAFRSHLAESIDAYLATLDHAARRYAEDDLNIIKAERQQRNGRGM